MVYENVISSGDRRTLLAIARRSVEAYLREGRAPEFEVDAEILRECRGAFVTLKNRGELRGCIGLIEADIPLYRVVSEMAAAAATEDVRFAPIGPEELPDLDIEISVLSRPRKIDDPAEIELGKHGVIVRQGRHSGVFLPQVAAETGWSLEEFMSHLCADKAGLDPDCWKTGEADVYVFTAEVFSEHE